MAAMGSVGEGSRDERNPVVTLQIQLMDRSKIYVQTEIDLTVEEFKLVLADMTGIPSDEQWLVHMGRILRNPQTLRSYELEPDRSIHLVSIGFPSPSTTIGSMPRESTPTSPSETYGLEATNESQIEPLIDKPDIIADIIKDIPYLSCFLAKWPNWAAELENPGLLHHILLYLLYNSIKVRMKSFKADLADNIKLADTEGSRKLKTVYEVPKFESVYEVHLGISHGREDNQLPLGLLGFNLVGTSGSGPESSNANQSELVPISDRFNGPGSSNANPSELAPNSDQLSGPESSNAKQSKSAPNTEPLPNPRAASSYSDDELVDPSYWQKVYMRTVDILVPIILSDATLLRRCKEQCERVDCAIAALLKDNNICQDMYTPAFCSLVIELDAYYRPIVEKFLPQNDADYGSGSSSDGSTGVAAKEGASEDLFASALAEMEQMGFMDRRENIRALLNSWGDVEKAIKSLSSRKKKN